MLLWQHITIDVSSAGDMIQTFYFDDVATRVIWEMKYKKRLPGLYCVDFIDRYTCIMKEISEGAVFSDKKNLIPYFYCFGLK